jgi:hypothetical protein
VGQWALIIVSATRQKNEEDRRILYFSVSHFSVWSVSVAKTTTEAGQCIKGFRLPVNA